MSDLHRCCWCNVSHGWGPTPPVALHLPEGCGADACAGNPMDCPGPVDGRCYAGPSECAMGFAWHRGRNCLCKTPKGWRREGDELIPPEGWQHKPLIILPQAPVVPPGPTHVQLNRESRGLLAALKRGLGRAWEWCKH